MTRLADWIHSAGVRVGGRELNDRLDERFQL